MWAVSRAKPSKQGGRDDITLPRRRKHDCLDCIDGEGKSIARLVIQKDLAKSLTLYNARVFTRARKASST